MIKYSICRLMSCEPEEVRQYWRNLEVAGFLQARLCDTVSPSWSDILDIARRAANQIYFVRDQVNGRLIGETMLENFTGKAAQLHFSMSADLSLKDKLQIGTDVTSDILDRWTSSPKGEPYLQTLIGIVPVKNRKACVFVLKTGFKKMMVIPSGHKWNGNEICDAMVAIKTRSC